MSVISIAKNLLSRAGDVPLIASFVVARGIPAVLNLGVVFLITRLLSPAEYGRYAVLWTSILLASAFFFQWVRISFLRFVKTDSYCEQAATKLARLGFTASTVALLIASGTVTLVLLVFGKDPIGPLSVGLVLMGAVGYGLTELALERFRASLSPKAYASRIVGRVCCILGGIGLAAALQVTSGPLVLLPVVMALLIYGTWIGRKFLTFKVSLSKPSDELLRFAAYGIPLAGSTIMAGIINYSDRIMLAMLDSNSAAGIYSAGYDLARQSVGSLALAANLAMLPLAIQAFESRDPSKFRLRMNRNFRIIASTVVPSTVFLVFFKEEISTLLVGPDFSAGVAVVLPLISVAALIEMFRIYYFDHVFHVSRRTRALLGIQIVAVICNLALNLLLIPGFGITGAMWATLVTNCIALVTSVSVGARSLRIVPPWRDWVGLLLASGILVVIGPSLVGGLQQTPLLPALLLAAMALLGMYLAATVGTSQVLLRLDRRRERATE